MLSKRKEEQIREPIFTILNSIEKQNMAVLKSSGTFQIKARKIGLVCLLYISSSSKLNHFYPNKDELWLHSS